MKIPLCLYVFVANKSILKKMRKPKIAIIFAGGTISMKSSKKSGGAVDQKRGVILGWHLPGQKARIKLMILLGKVMSVQQIKKAFESRECFCA